MCIYRDTGRQMLFGLNLEFLLIFTPVNFEVSGGEVACSCWWSPEWFGLGTAAWSQCFSHNYNNILVTIAITLFLSDHKGRINKLLFLWRFFFFLNNQTNPRLFLQTPNVPGWSARQSHRKENNVQSLGLWHCCSWLMICYLRNEVLPFQSI